MPRQIQVCPECESSQTDTITGRYEGTPRKKCKSCGHEFREYAVVETTHADARKGLAGELEQANPDDVGGSA